MGDKFSHQKKAELCLYQNPLATGISCTRAFKVLLFHKTTTIIVEKNLFFIFPLGLDETLKKNGSNGSLNGTHKLTDIEFPSLLGFICKEINEDNTDPATASVEPVLPEQRLSLSLNFAFA